MLKLKSIALGIYNLVGDKRTKNVIIVILMLMTAFGMVAPQTATSLRDMTLSMIS